MKFKVSKVAAAVAVGLGTSVIGVNVAQADSAFFPYLIASPAVTTILSVVDEGSAVANTMHYRYYYKKDAGSTVTNRISGCTEANYSNWSSQNDVVSFDISNHFGAGNGVLFEGTTPTARYSDFALFRDQTVRANAIVDNNAQAAFGRTVNGEAFIIEFDKGSVWGYPAYNAAKILTFTPPKTVAVANEYDFSDRAEVNGEVLVQPVPATLTAAAALERFRVPITIMPFAEVTTRLFVAPVNPNPPFQVPVERNIYTTNIRLEVNDNTTLQQVMFDRDEQPVSGRVTQPITCVGAVDIPDLINEAIRSRVANGGWAYVGIQQGTLTSVPVITDTGTVNTAPVNVNQAIVLKLEFNDKTPALLNGQDAGGGSYNNGFWLRKGFRESVPRDFALTGYPVLPVFQMPDEIQESNSPYMVINTAGVDAYNAKYPGSALPVSNGYVPLALNPAQGIVGNTSADYVIANSKVPGVVASYNDVKSALQ